MRITHYSFFLLLTLVFAACSMSETQSSLAPADIDLTSFEFYIAKRTKAGIEFEQYTLDGDRIFRECGKIQRGRQIAEVQDFWTLEPDSRAEIAQQLGLYFQAREASRSKLAAPGDNGQLWDEGQLYLTLRLGEDESDVQVIKTSVDSIASPRTDPEAKLKKLAMKIRELGAAKACPNPLFFGLSSKIVRETP